MAVPPLVLVAVPLLVAVQLVADVPLDAPSTMKVAPMAGTAMGIGPPVRECRRAWRRLCVQ